MKLLFPPCLVFVIACASTPAIRAAERGDRVALASAILARERTGELSNGEAAALARAVAGREIRGAAGPEAVERIHDVAACGHELDGTLAARSETHDDAGAEAALARLDGRRLGLGDARSYLGDTNAHWRAVATRALIRDEDHDARVRAMLDPEPGVRRGALRAARDAHDEADLSGLADAARVDPNPMNRSEAVRAIGALPAATGDRVANLLRDLWAVGDDGLREDIADAWSSPDMWGAGGRQALRVVLASDHGPGAIEAAAAVLRRQDADGEMADLAIAQLATSIEQGALRTRLQALAAAPMDRPVLLGLVRKTADTDDPNIRVAALARLAEGKDARAIDQLERFSQPGSPVAQAARLALANAGDRRVQLWIEQDLAAEAPERRLAAATALAALGVAARAAGLLADADPRVRMRAACTILVAARRCH
jgi:hypothetical protein